MMQGESFALSIQLLRSVLAGTTYESAARANGITRTAVERRVKSLVLTLVRERRVIGLRESQLVFVRKLRAHRGPIESALQDYSPALEFKRAPASPVLSEQEVQTAVRQVRVRSSTPERDVAMVLIVLATGLRPLEVARLEVSDYLRPDGSARVASKVREEVASNGRARPLHFSSSNACSALDAYLARRVVGGAALDGSSYRGLHGRDPLFLTAGGRRFHVEVTTTADGQRCLCQEIHHAYRQIFRHIGYPGLSALRLRHTVMDRLRRRGADDGQIGELLGIRELRSAKRREVRLEELVNELV